MTHATATHTLTGTWHVDPVHSIAGFRIRHFGLTWLRGRFGRVDVTLGVDEQGTMRLAGSTEVTSIEFPNPQLHGHLMGPDFFDAERHPRITFTATDVDLAGDATALVRGELTIRGESRPIELRGTWNGPIEDLGGNERIALELAGSIDRFDHGLRWAANLPGGGDVLGREVRLEGEFELVRG